MTYWLRKENVAQGQIRELCQPVFKEACKMILFEIAYTQ